MGLKETFQNAAVTIGGAFGNVFASVRYEAYVTTAYNVSAGVTSVVASSYFVSMVFEDYKKTEVDGSHILNSDVKATIPQLNLAPIPTTHDSVIRVEAGVSVTYEVVDYGQDPAGAIWEIQLRKP